MKTDMDAIRELTHVLVWDFRQKLHLHSNDATTFVRWLRQRHLSRARIDADIKSFFRVPWLDVKHSNHLQYRAMPRYSEQRQVRYEMRGRVKGEVVTLVVTTDLDRLLKLARRIIHSTNNQTKQSRKIKRVWYAWMFRDYEQRKGK